MRIRWKLFWLLAAISLGPILLLRINSQFALTRLADRLAGRVADHLVTETETRMRRLVEDHARLLDSRRQTLALAVAMQAMAAEKALSATPPPSFAPETAVLVRPWAMGMGMGMRRSLDTADAGFTREPGYFRQIHDGDQEPLPVDRNRLTLRLRPGQDQPDAPAAALAGLLPAYRRVAALTGPLAHFQVTVLADGLAASYPATPGAPRRNDPRRAPWYTAALQAAEPLWTAPQLEPGTGRISVAVSCRVGPAGGPARGVTVIFTPLDDLLASVSMPGHIANDVVSLLVSVAPDAGPKPRLLAQAGEIRRERGQGWHAFVTPAPLASSDKTVLDAIAADVAAGNSGVRRLAYEGRDSLAAYASTDKNEALLQIAPVADLLAQSRTMAADVQDSVHRLTAFGTAIVGAVMLALLFVSISASRAVTRPVLALTRAAGRLAEGDFTARVDTPGKDEIARLGAVFNEMAPRLEAHLQLCETMQLASEIQRSLLPAHPPAVPGLDLAAASRYCDETGGDYYDFLSFDGPKAGKLGVVLGDVSGHGLEAALLMTTARALLRPRAAAPGSPGEVLADVNRELTRDVYGTGRFMTLFYLELDPAARAAAFARGGHDPALRFDPATGRIDELTARGMALGVAEQARFETGAVTGLAPGQTILIGSDGLWEAENEAGEMFGKARTREVLAASAPHGAQAVLDALFDALDAFRGARPLDDDVTLVVVAMGK